MAKKPPYFPFYPGDFANDGKVEAMSTTAVGAYILLLCKAWHETPPATIPDDDCVLARWSRLNPLEWSECKSAVLSCWRPCGDGRLVQPRLKVEYDKFRSKSGKASNAAAKRWESVRNANALQRAYGSDSGSDPPMDLRIWEGRERELHAILRAYPPKGRSRSDAAVLEIKAAIERIAAQGEADPFGWLMARVKAYAASPQGQPGGFTLAAVNWFKDGCYNDPPESWEKRDDGRSGQSKRGTAGTAQGPTGLHPSAGHVNGTQGSYAPRNDPLPR